MKIIETSRFRKSFSKLAPSVKTRAKKQFALFLQNLFHPSLHTEKLEPRQANVWSFRISKNHRVIFTFQAQDIIVLLDVGPHDIYRKKK